MSSPYWTADLGDGIGPREDTDHEARTARLADELEAVRRERDQFKTDLLELRGIVRSVLHGATDLERELGLSVLRNMVRAEERTGLRLVGVAP